MSYDYEHTDRDGDSLTVQQASEAAIFVGVSNGVMVHVSADKRREVARAIAGEKYRVILADTQSHHAALEAEIHRLGSDNDDLRKQLHDAEAQAAQPDTSAAAMQEDLARILDALGLPVVARPYSPHECVTRDVLPAIERLRGRADEAYEKGYGEGVNWGLSAARQPDRPEPVDPASVKVGDVVEIEADDGSWMVRGKVGRKMDDSADWHLLIEADVWADDCIRPQLDVATVRILHAAEPEPDEAAVEALAQALYAAKATRIGLERDWSQIGNTDRLRHQTEALTLIRDHGVEVPADG